MIADKYPALMAPQKHDLIATQMKGRASAQMPFVRDAALGGEEQNLHPGVAQGPQRPDALKADGAGCSQERGAWVTNCVSLRFHRDDLKKRLQPCRPTPALCLSNPLATFRGSRPCAGAAMVCASPAASEALTLTRMSRPCLCSARLPPQLAKPGALLTVACTFCCHATLSHLSGRPLQLTQTNPLFVLTHSLIDVAFEPVIFGCHLRPHDAPARACAYWCRNHTKAVARPVPSLDLGPTAGGHLCQCFAHRRPAQQLPALGLGNFDIKSLEILFRYPTAFEFRVIIAGLGEDLKQVCDMNFGYCWFWSPLPVQASELRRPTSPTTRSPSFWCLRWHRVLDRRRCRRLKITVEDHGLDLCRRHRSTIGSGSPAAPHIGGMLRKTPFAPTR